MDGGPDQGGRLAPGGDVPYANCGLPYHVGGVIAERGICCATMRGGLTAEDLADLEPAFAPPYKSAKDPVSMLGYIAEICAPPPSTSALT